MSTRISEIESTEKVEKKKSSHPDNSIDKTTDKSEKEPIYVPPPPYEPPVPFPQRLAKAKLDKQFGKFLEVLKKLYINIPFTDALTQMPSYAKFLKEILSNKRKLEDYETVALTEECSALIQNKLTPKLKDPGSFSIPCVIGNVSFDHALCDLGASVSLMPLSVSRKLELGQLKPTTITLQLADRSVKYPVGMLEDVPIRVGKFFIPTDFVVLDMDEDSQIPIFLGRPFLATAGAIIDVKNGRLSLNIGDERVEFSLYKSVANSSIENSCYRIDEAITKDKLAKNHYKDPLEARLVIDGLIEEEDEIIADIARLFEGNPPLTNVHESGRTNDEGIKVLHDKKISRQKFKKWRFRSHIQPVPEFSLPKNRDPKVDWRIAKSSGPIRDLH